MAIVKRTPLQTENRLLDELSEEQQDFLQIKPNENQKETKLKISENQTQTEQKENRRETITLRADSIVIQMLHDMAEARKKTRQFPWTKWEIVTEALKEWFSKHKR